MGLGFLVSADQGREYPEMAVDGADVHAGAGDDDEEAGEGAQELEERCGPFPVADRKFIDTAHRRDIRVHIWTIDDAAEMDRLLDLGVDGIMTDRPAVLREVLESRGDWV